MKKMLGKLLITAGILVFFRRRRKRCVCCRPRFHKWHRS